MQIEGIESLELAPHSRMVAASDVVHKGSATILKRFITRALLGGVCCVPR